MPPAAKMCHDVANHGMIFPSIARMIARSTCRIHSRIGHNRYIRQTVPNRLGAWLWRWANSQANW
jgi:hypothetical protein